MAINKLLTPEELSDLLGVKKSTIYQWTHTHYIPHVKVGRFVRFRPEAIEAWLKKRSIRATTRKDVVDSLWADLNCGRFKKSR